MHFAITTTIVTLGCLAAAEHPRPSWQTNASAIPVIKCSSLVNADNSVNLDALHSHTASIRAKILRSFDNDEQNTARGRAHSTAVKRDTITNSGTSLELTNHKSVLWYGTITIGTPPMPFTVDIDTGTGDFFIPSSTCGSTCDGHTRWIHDESETARDLGRPFAAKFGDGAVISGDLYTDNVTIAGFTATTQAIGAATTYSAELARSLFPADGTMGLAFRTLSSARENTVFETLVDEKQVTDPVFSLMLTSTGGELYIGGSNDAMYKGDFTYTKVTKQVYWQVQIQYIMSNDKMILKNIPAIIDSGSNLIYGNPLQVFGLHSKLGGKPVPRSIGQGLYTFPCDEFPTVSLTFNGRSFPISGFKLGRLSPNSPRCLSGILDLDAATSFWVIGGAFLQGVYTKFDLGNLQVGFADLAQEPKA